MDGFAAAATRLAGVAGVLFGWRPHEFWAATPGELEALARALRPAEDAPATPNDLNRLQEMFPDG